MATITASSRTATTTTSLPRSTSVHHDGGYDLKACLEILKKLAPKVSPDLPPPLILPSTSSSSNNNNVTQTTTQQLKRKKGSDEDRGGASDSSVKRSKTINRERSSSPENDAAEKKKKSTSTRNSSLSNSSTSRQLNGHSGGATIPTTTTTTATSAANHTHKRSTSTVSLQDLKARSNKAKMSNEATNTNNGYLSSSSSTMTTTTKTTKYTQHASDLSISTNTAGPSAISPTLPSPAPTLSSTRSSNHPNNNVHSAASSVQQQQQQPISAPSPEAIALGNGNIKWTRERFKRIAAICREKGRALKHAGDKRMREYSSPSTASSSSSSSSSNTSSRDRHITPILALFEQIDAVILYAYAFWCEDQAAGCVRGRQASNSSLHVGTPNLLANSTNADHSNMLGASTSSITCAPGGGGNGGPSISSTSSTSTMNALGNSANAPESATTATTNYTWKAGCIAENWKSIFGLVSFVRGRAEKLMVSPPSALMRSAGGSGYGRRMEGLPRAMEIVVAWMNMLEALILQHLTTNSSRQLNSQANRLLSSNITSTCSNSSTTGLSPAEGAGGPNSAGATNGGDNESIISTTSSATSPQETNHFLQNFLKLQGDLERIHTLWPASQNILLHPDQSALTSSYSTAQHSNGDGHASGSGTGRLNARDEEDILSLVLRKGRMAYDYEPTKLDDIVMPNLPRDEEDQEEETNFDANDDSMDAEGEIDTDIPETNNINTKSNTSTHLTTTSKTSNISSNNNNCSNGNGGNAGPKSPEDLFKDEENYFRFSWPIIIHHRNAIAHTTSFGRALIFEMASRLGVDYTSPDILPSKRS